MRLGCAFVRFFLTALIIFRRIKIRAPLGTQALSNAAIFDTMKDDDFSGIVRSGTSHSVSVSERTGNAKTPKNIVTSKAEETLEKKIAFETKSDDNLYLEQLGHEVEGAHPTQPAPTTHGAPDAKEAVAAGGPGAKPQASPQEPGQTRPNIQGIATDKLAKNVQNIGTDALAANVQNISLDVIEANQQKIEGNDKLATNRQGLASDAQSAPNVQGVPIDTMAANVQDVPVNTIAANTQNVPIDKVEANQQKLDGNSPITPNKQALASKASDGPNVQGVPIDTVAANVQGIPTDALEDNHQALDNDALPANQQRIDEETVAANLQALPSKAEGSNRAALNTDAATDNTQALPHDTAANNTQPAPTLAAGDNHQAAGEGGMVPANRQGLAAAPALETNRQGIDTPAPELNRQAAPQDLPPPDNRQALDDEHLKDHFEALPSTATERKKVDFPTSNPAPSATKPASVAPAALRAKAKPTAPATAAQRQAALTAAQQAQHEKFLEAFHGRLAGIKHDVDQINDRLDVFEHKK